MSEMIILICIKLINEIYQIICQKNIEINKYCVEYFHGTCINMTINMSSMLKPIPGRIIVPNFSTFINIQMKHIR